MLVYTVKQKLDLEVFLKRYLRNLFPKYNKNILTNISRKKTRRKNIMVVAIGLILILLAGAFYAGIKLSPKPDKVEVPIFDADKACAIAAGLDGSDIEMAKVFAKGALATVTAFGIDVTAKDDCASKADDLKKTNIEVEKRHTFLKVQKETLITRLNEEIDMSARKTANVVGENSAKAGKYEEASKIFFG